MYARIVGASLIVTYAIYSKDTSETENCKVITKISLQKYASLF